MDKELRSAWSVPVEKIRLPRALADLGDIGETSGVFEALALSGAAFILADRGRLRWPERGDR